MTSSMGLTSALDDLRVILKDTMLFTTIMLSCSRFLRLYPLACNLMLFDACLPVSTLSFRCKPFRIRMESRTQRTSVLTLEEDPSPWLAENGVLGLTCTPPAHPTRSFDTNTNTHY